MRQNVDYRRESDRRDNDEMRLPENESVHIGGLVLTEAFTPSTVSGLYRALEQIPSTRTKEWLDALTKSRQGGGGGWLNLGVARAPGEFVLGNGFHDSQLPKGIQAVWLHLNLVTPSITVVTATFTIDEEFGDFSSILRNDYESSLGPPEITIFGRAAKWQSRIPWARPKAYQAWQKIRHPEAKKSAACQQLVRNLEEACRTWFAEKFPGRFARSAPNTRPTIRILLTHNHGPFLDRKAKWFRPVGLDQPFDSWRSTENGGWTVKFRSCWQGDGEQVVTFAARRKDLVKDTNRGEENTSNWYITQRFPEEFESLIVHHSVTSLLILYGNILGDLRDRPTTRFRVRRPVREARELDRYLVGDGLDAATITEEVGTPARVPTFFGLNHVRFTENLDHLQANIRKQRAQRDLSTLLRAGLEKLATRLTRETSKTISNIRASAELRQAIANTRLQRFVLLLTVVATVIALIGLMAHKS